MDWRVGRRPGCYGNPGWLLIRMMLEIRGRGAGQSWIYACYGGVPIGFGGISQYFSVPAPSGKQCICNFVIVSTRTIGTLGLTDSYDYFDVYVNGVASSVMQIETQTISTTATSLLTILDGARVRSIWGPGDEYITLSFEVHNRADGWYNTYVYVDDVEMVFVD